MPKNFAHLGGLNAYEVLGIEPTATTEEIEAAYRAAIKRQHSDTGGVTRLAQLVNDARDALVKDRASYDAWLRARPRVAEAEPDPEPAAPASDSSRSTRASADEVPDEDVWDPWDTVGPQTPPGTRNQPGAATPSPVKRKTPLSAEERRSGMLAVLASVLCGPLGLWLGIRSYRRSGSAVAAVAIVVGGMSVLYLATLAIAIPLGLFQDTSLPSFGADPTVMKQGQVRCQARRQSCSGQRRHFVCAKRRPCVACGDEVRPRPRTRHVICRAAPTLSRQLRHLFGTEVSGTNGEADRLESADHRLDVMREGHGLGNNQESDHRR